MMNGQVFLGQVGLHNHEPGMGECMVCKVKRLKEESEAEFRRRYPMTALPPAGMAGSGEKELGCCGYDEIAYKPPTTSSINAAFLSTKRLRGEDLQNGLVKRVIPLQNI
jgi:hypothetical protein